MTLLFVARILYIYMQLPHVGDSSYIHMLFQSHSDKQYNCRHILKCVTRTLLVRVQKLNHALVLLLF